jgi:hypothetical protein
VLPALTPIATAPPEDVEPIPWVLYPAALPIATEFVF